MAVVGPHRPRDEAFDEGEQVRNPLKIFAAWLISYATEKTINEIENQQDQNMSAIADSLNALVASATAINTALTAVNTQLTAIDENVKALQTSLANQALPTDAVTALANLQAAVSAAQASAAAVTTETSVLATDAAPAVAAPAPAA